MPYEVMIIRDKSTHEFICDDVGDGTIAGTVSFVNVVDPADQSRYHKLIFLAPGDIMNFREIKE